MYVTIFFPQTVGLLQYEFFKGSSTNEYSHGAQHIFLYCICHGKGEYLPGAITEIRCSWFPSVVVWVHSYGICGAKVTLGEFENFGFPIHIPPTAHSLITLSLAPIYSK
jgi:hypothetical protein